jgi:hypothetical protein
MDTRAEFWGTKSEVGHVRMLVRFEAVSDEASPAADRPISNAVLHDQRTES